MCACVSIFQQRQFGLEMQYSIFERPLHYYVTPPSQDRDADVSGLQAPVVPVVHEITQVGNPCINTLAHTIDTDMHTDKGTKKSPHRHEQIYLSSRLRIMFFVLLVSMSPNSCRGACAMHVPYLARTRNLSLYYDLHTDIQSVVSFS